MTSIISYKKTALMLVLLAVGIAIYVSRQDRIRLYRDSERLTHASLLKHIPIGAGESSAQDIMENNGFRCGVNDTLIQGQVIRVIGCRKRDWTLRGTWRVGLFLQEGRVNRIVVSYDRLAL